MGGIKFSVTGPPKKRSISYQLSWFTTHFQDPHLLVHFLTRSLMNYVTRTRYCPTVNHFLHYSTSLLRNANKNQKSSRKSSPSGIRVSHTTRDSTEETFNESIL